jgi:tetratricopeptide (TPR) repeat protein
LLEQPDSIITRHLSRNEQLTCFSQIGEITWSERKFSESVYFFARALALCPDKDPAEEVPFYLFKIGRSLYSLSDLPGAKIAYTAALDHYRQGYPPGFEKEIISLRNNLGLCQMNLGKYIEAEKQFIECASTAKKEGFVTENIQALNNLAILYQKQGKLEESLQLLERGLELAIQINEPVAICAQKGNIANARFLKGDYPGAIALYRECISTPDPHPSRFLPYFNNLALAYFNSGNIDSAAFCNDQELGMIGDPEDPEPGTSVSDCLDALGVYEEIQLARFQATGNFEYIYSCFESFKKGMRCIFLRLDDEFTIDYMKSFLAQHRAFFTVSMKSALHLDSLAPRRIPRSAVVSEAMKAVSVLDGSVSRNQKKSDSEVASENISLNNSWKYIDDFTHGRISETSRQDLCRTLIINPFDEAVGSLKINQELIARFDTIEQSIEQVIKNRGNRNILDYFLMEDQLIIHQYSPEGIRVHKIQTGKSILYDIDQLSAAIQQLRNKEVSKISSALSEYMIDPVVDALVPGEITFIPDDKTIRIPMEILFTGENEKKDYLINTRPLTYSFTLLNWSNLPDSEEDYPLTFCGIAPDLKSETPQASVTRNIGEIFSIDSLYRATGHSSLVLTGGSAVIDSLLKYANKSKILCISTHLSQDESSAQMNRLILDGHSALYLPVMKNLRLGNDLLILGICSALENFIENQETYNSFLKSVNNTDVSYCLGCLWRLYDLPFMKFNIEFNRLIAEGDSYSVALQKTKKMFIGSIEFNQPIFWAGIQLFEIRHNK